MNLTRILALTMILSVSMQAGPAIACKWTAVPGSVFATLGPLRERAYYADDSPAAGEKALKELAQLRAEIKADDPVSLLRAGFWAATMHDIRISRESDGPALILKALAIRPNDPEYHFFAALAHLHTDKAVFHKHWELARTLAKSGSATAVNMNIVEGLYRDLMD